MRKIALTAENEKAFGCETAKVLGARRGIAVVCRTLC